MVSEKKIYEISAVIHAAISAHATHGDPALSPVWYEKTGDIYKKTLSSTVEFCLSRDNVTGEDIHDLWVTGQLEKGWQWGVELDSKKKRDPFLVPYRQLPAGVRMRYELTADIVRIFKDCYKL